MSARPEALDSYLSGRWLRGEGIETALIDPVTGDELATVSAKGLDLASALEFARREGQRSLRNLSYAERGKLVGAVTDVLVDGPSEDSAFAWEGRTAGQAPEIDGVVYLRGRGDFTPGRFARVRIAEVEGYELVGERA